MIQDDGEFDNCLSPGLNVVWDYNTAATTATTTPPPTAAVTARNNKYVIMNIEMPLECPLYWNAILSDLKQPWLPDWRLFHNNQESSFHFFSCKKPCFQIINFFSTVFFPWGILKIPP